MYVQLHYNQSVVFDWDDRKEAANIRKHGVGFWEAQTVFHDPLAKQFLDPHPTEERFVLTGQSARARLILARKPTTKERRAYEEGI